MSTSESPTPIPTDAIEPDPEPVSDADPLVPVEPETQAAATEPELPAEPVAEPDPILAVLERLEDRLEESQRLLARQSEIATSLHAENQRLKAGELVRAQLPLVRDLISVHDVLGQMLNAKVESTAVTDLELVQEALIDALGRNGIEKAEVAEGDALDPRRHKVVSVAPIDDATADRTIAEVVKVGFAWDEGTTIRATDVRVYKHTPATPAEVSPAPAPDAGEAQS